MLLALKPINEILGVNNFMFGLAFEGVDETTARKQLKDNANSLIWLLGHTASVRFYLLGLTGKEENCPWGEIFESSIATVDHSRFPKLAEIKSVWDELSVKIAESLPKLTEAQLNESIAFKLPTQDQTVLAGLSFLTMHESYHIGQVSTQRRLLGIDSLFDLAKAKRKAAQT